MRSMKESPSRNRLVWRIGQLAKAAGVSTDTLRHYERKGLLHSQRTRNGYRQYSEGALERVGTIRKALAVGFTLDELSAIFKVFDRGGAPCHQVRTLAASKLAQIESHLSEVLALRDDLKNVLKDWDKRLAKTTSGQRAGLLKALAARNGLHSSTRLLLGKSSSKKG
jgi:DNA-binding transcriptional MerR regulator